MASLLASRGENITAIAAAMLAVRSGRRVAAADRGVVVAKGDESLAWPITCAGAGGKFMLGAGALAIALLVLTGLDRTVESALAGLSPDWLTDLTTRFRCVSTATL